MDEALTRATMIRSLIETAQRDPRIVGLADYGSSSEGRNDEWSDIDLAVFLRDDDYEPFAHEWKVWAAQFGPLLLAFISGVGHPWTVYDAAPVPLRVDFGFHRESAIEEMLTWPNAPVSVEAMVWYDATADRLTACARQLVGQSLAPADLSATYERIGGDYWYYVLRTLGKIARQEEWAARYEFNVIIMGLLHALLRLEAGAVERWRASESASGIEHVLTPRRLMQLNACIPGPGLKSVHQALIKAVELGSEVCIALGTTYGWPWPAALADRTLLVLTSMGPADHR